jgi:hypothetical protein
MCIYIYESGSSVNIATDYGLNGSGSILGTAKFFSSPQRLDRFWAYPGPIHWVQQAFSPGGKAAGACGWPLTSMYRRGQASSRQLIKHRNNFSFIVMIVTRTALKNIYVDVEDRSQELKSMNC